MVDDEKCEVCALSILNNRHLNYHAQLVFLYKLIDGIAESSFGTHVAALAGVPAPVVSRAATISTDFAAQFKRRIEGKREKDARLTLDAQADFAFLVKLARAACEKENTNEASRAMRREILRGLAKAVPMYTQTAA